MSRLLALAVPLFPLAALLRAEPALAGETVVVCEGEGGGARVLAASRRARRLGVRPGLTLARARALAPHLVVRGRDPAAEASAQEALAEAAGTVSPRVERAEPGLVLADLAGCERLHPDEAELARAALLAAGRRGLPAARAGIAASRPAAELAARRSPTPTVVPPGGDRAFLEPLPVATLRPPRRLLERLAAWGVRTLGELARLPEAEVAARLGPEGVALHRAARGVDLRPLVPAPPPPVLVEARALDWPAVRLEPFLAAVRRSLELLCRRLEGEGLGCRKLEAELELEPGGAARRTVHLPAPTADAATLLDLLRLALERDPPGAPVAGYTLLAHPATPRRAQMTLFGPEEPSPERTGAAVARIAARVGPDRVGSPAPRPGHLPGPPHAAPFAPPPPPRVAPPPRPARGLLAVRRLHPPRPVEVILEGKRPRSLRTPPGVRPHLQGLVRVASGPWQLEEGWWEGDAPEAREYWDVELSGGELVRLFRRPDGEWYADGLHD